MAVEECTDARAPIDGAARELEPNQPGATSWTITSAVRRAVHLARDEGLRKVWFSVLGETVYRRLRILTYDVGESAPSLSSDPDIEFGELRPSDVADYVEFRLQDPGLVHARFDAGDRCFVARCRGQLISSCWVMSGHVSIAYLGYSESLPDGIWWLLDTWTAPEHRGRAIAPRVWTKILEAARRNQIRRIFTTVLPENQASLRARAKGGFRPVGTMMRIELGGHTRHFVYPPAARTWTAPN